MVIGSLLGLIEIGDLNVRRVGYGHGYAMSPKLRPVTIQNGLMPAPVVLDKMHKHRFILFLRRKQVGRWFPRAQWILDDDNDQVIPASQEELAQLAEACEAVIRGDDALNKSETIMAVHQRLQSRLDQIIGEHES